MDDIQSESRSVVASLSRARDTGLDSFKGILICLIVLGHNYFFSRYYPDAFAFIYGFHVVSFLLFPFLFISRPAPLSKLPQQLRRIFVPHFWFLAIAAAAYCAIHVVAGNVELGNWLRDTGWALLVQRETTFRQAFGGGFFWFLPALAIQTVILAIYTNLSSLARGGIFVVALIWHAVVGLVDSPVLFQLPYSLSIVTYVFVLGIAVHWLHARLNWTWARDALLILVWVAGAVLCFRYRFFHPLAGDMSAPPLSIAEPWSLLLRDGFLVLSFFAILRFAQRADNFIIYYIGRRSLQVFLLHPFVWQALWSFGLNKWGDAGGYSPALLTLMSLSLTLTVVLAAERLIVAVGLAEVLFPSKRREAIA